MATWWRDLRWILQGLDYSQHENRVGSLPSRKQSRRRMQKCGGATGRQVVERLEDRTLLSTLPLPEVPGHTDIVNPGAGNYNSPALAYDPSQPDRLVSVYSYHATNGETRVEGRYSADGGATWTGFGLPGNMRSPLSDKDSYSRAEEPSVAFDAAGNFYITYVEYALDKDSAVRQAGAVVLQKYGFDDTDVPQNLDITPDDGAFSVLYQWVTTTKDNVTITEAAFNPYVAVDTNPASFQDPVSNAEVTDKYAGSVYAAWSQQRQEADGSAVHDIMLVGSIDGGTNFSGAQVVDDKGEASYPRLVVSGGTADGRVTPGQLSLIWDSYGDEGSTIYLDKVTNGVQGLVVQGTATDIADGAAPDTTQDPPPDPPVTAHTPGETTSSVTVTLPVGFVPTDVDLELVLTDPILEHLSIVLSHGAQKVTLVQNGKDADDKDMGAGVTGTVMGIMQGVQVGTVFDDQALRGIRDGAAPFIGHFQAESGTLASLLRNGAGGQWTLTITDYRENPEGSAAGRLESWALHFTAGLTTGTDTVVATTKLEGALDGPFPNLADVMPERGIGPGATIASDNTLGSFSPYQGRLYVAYTDRETDTASDKTNIYLKTSDDGGATWSLPVRVNDDNGAMDGFSEGVRNTRPHFQPEVAVDQTTGTLVLSFYDARHDASRVRVARYLATSIDGGVTFGPQTYVNESNEAIDAITGLPVDLGPIPDNQSNAFDNRDKLYSFGDRQGMAVVNGRINLAWSGNKNNNHNEATDKDDRGLGILGAVAQIASGPRILDDSGTMGPVSLPNDVLNPAVDGQAQFSMFEVTFDRPIDATSFTKDAVTVMYRDVNTSGNVPGVIVNVKSVTPMDEGKWGPAEAVGATRFLIELETPQTAVGTYSYFINPVMRDGIRTLTSLGNMPDQDSDGVTGEAAVADTSIGDVYAIPRPASDKSFKTTYFAAPFDSDTLPIIVSGPRVVETEAVAVYPAEGNQVGLRVPPTGNGGTGVPADDNTLSTITFPASSEMLIRDLNIHLSLYHESDGDLKIILIAPDGTQVILVNGAGGNNEGFYNTVFDDGARQGILDGLPPFTGAFRPQDPLSVLNGQRLAGTWTLEIQDRSIEGGCGELYGWSMEVETSTAAGENLVLNNTVSALDVKFDADMDPSTFTPDSILRVVGLTGVISGPFVITGNPLGTDPDRDYPRTYRISFPSQQLSGTYTLTLASSIKSKTGLALDNNLNAGVDVLFDHASEFLPVTVNTHESIAIGSGTQAGVVSESYIDVTDAFLVGGVTVGLSITYANDPNLEAVLIAPDGTMVSLFHGLGNIGSGRNFTQTVFDDAAQTPIQNGAAPFFGRFNPRPSEELPLRLTDLQGKTSVGRWTLRITAKEAGAVGTLDNWSLTLQKPLPSTGLGELVSDQYTASFRIFTMDPTEDLSHGAWTPVGPNAAGGRTTAIAVDPSDPSGNTVYVGSASGGLWKTTNFLTSDPNGPTYVPLTDFGPILAMRIGSIAVFPRNGDPNQSVIIAGTGEGDDRTTGVGFLLSLDGGATWALLDSTTNVDASGAWLPIDSPDRNHRFVNTTSYRVVVDPQVTPAGEVIIYAALSGGQAGAGIWRSLDTGKHWTLMRGGQATDVVLDPNSGYYDVYGNATGNLQVIYGAFRGEGVLRSPNRGQTWLTMPGGMGVSMIRDVDSEPLPLAAVPVVNNASTPNGAKGRIVLAKPTLTGDPVQDLLYQGWLYAAVVGESAGWQGLFDGLYVTKDYGQNWTRVRLPNTADPDRYRAYPTNDTTRPDYDVVGGGGLTVGAGNYDLSLAVDPNNPNVVYVGGTTRTGAAGLIRVDITALADPYALYTAQDRPGGGVLDRAATDAVTLKDTVTAGIDDAYVNLLQDPFQPFALGSTLLVSGVASIANSGTGARWNAFDANLLYGSFHYLHQLVTMTDPATGKTRLIIADEQGVYSTVDDGTGKIESGIGTRTTARGDRSGNLQVMQLLYGAAQPNSIASQAAGALFYGSTEHSGVVASPVDVLENGDLVWGTAPGAWQGGAGGVATSQTGDGGVYLTRFPADNSIPPDFFLWNGAGRTWGLIQQTTNGNWTGDPQWPDLWASNFAVNPVDPNQIVISSINGRVFATENQGRFWSVIGDPANLDGSYVRTFAYGAADPNGTNGNDATNFLIYAGTSLGNVYVTFSGGGYAGNNWLRLPSGLGNSPIQSIVTNPLRGSHELYVVTEAGVYHMADCLAPNATWEDITGNLKALTYDPFGNPDLVEPLVGDLTSIVADWRYVIPDDAANPTGSTHPVLYVAGEGGVFRSLDNGRNWKAFPDGVVDGAPINGGGLPSVRVNDLDLAIGNINPTTGREVVAGSPDVLLATTYGRGSFAIRLAPIILPGSLELETDNQSAPLSGVLPPIDQDAVFTGVSQQTAFGNKVRISLVDMTDPDNPVVIGGFSGVMGDATDTAENWTDEYGHFSVKMYSNVFLSDGAKRIGVRATDDAGTVGEAAIIGVTLDLESPIVTPAEISATEGMPFTGKVASFTDTSGLACTARIDWSDGTVTSGTIVANEEGGYDVIGTHTFAHDGVYSVAVTITDPAGNPAITVSSVATVADQQIVPTGGLSGTVAEGTEGTGVIVATFTDPGGLETVDHYSATIDWGGGETSAGTITYNAQTRVFSVVGRHVYADNGTNPVVVTITHDQMPAVTVQSRVVVTNAKPAPTITGPGFASAGVECVFTVGSTDSSAVDVAAGFTYVITWGDGSASETIAATPDNGQSIAVPHTFDRIGTFKVQVAATDKDGGVGYSQTLTVQVGKATAAQSVVINGGLATRSRIWSVSFMPSYKGVQPDTLSLSQIRLFRNGGQEVPLTGARLTYKAGVASLNLNKTPLADGDYQIQVSFGRGDVLPVDFFKLTGDADGSGVVDATDRVIAQRNVGYWKGKPGYDPNADVNADDAVTTADVKLARSLAGRKIAGTRQWLTFYPNKPIASTPLNLGTVSQKSGYAAIDLMLYNGGEAPLRIKGLDLANGSVCSFAASGQAWSRPAGELVIEAGQRILVRVYMDTAQLGTISDQLTFQYSLDNGAKYSSLSLPITGTVVS